MEHTQFQSAVQDLAARFQILRDSGTIPEACDWQDVDLIKSQSLPSGSGHFLRITKRQIEQPADDKQPEELLESIETEDVEEDDESLPKFTTPSQGNTTLITYDMIYSPTYCVPVLYIHKPIPPTFLSDVDDAGLSLVDHPITSRPVYFVHPCRTSEAVREILGTGQASGIEWLMVWFGVIGASAGLNVPLEVAKGMQS